MKKTLLILSFCGLLALGAAAQDLPPAQFSIGPEVGVPVGQANQVYSVVIGGSIKFQVPVSPSLAVTFTGGYSSFMVNNTYSGEIQSAGYVPITAGVRFHFTPVAYIAFDAGVSVNTNSNYTAASSAFVYSPIVGFSPFAGPGGSSIDVGFRYEGRVENGGTVGQIAVRVAYNVAIAKRTRH